MEVKLTIVRAGETPELVTAKQPLAGALTSAVLIEDGTSGGRPSIMLIAERENDALVVELTYQIFDMISGAAHGAFGPPTAPFGVVVPTGSYPAPDAARADEHCK